MIVLSFRFEWFIKYLKMDLKCTNLILENCLWANRQFQQNPRRDLVQHVDNQ